MRGWKGRIVGKGIYGFLNGLLAMLKHKNKASQERTRFMELLTIRDGCCGQLDFAILESSKEGTLQWASTDLSETATT
jgi:hypothetical protein